jgi:hypothetical protein
MSVGAPVLMSILVSAQVLDEISNTTQLNAESFIKQTSSSSFSFFLMPFSGVGISFYLWIP